MRRSAAFSLIGLLFAYLALAADPNPPPRSAAARAWSAGVIAERTSAVLPPREPLELEFPKSLTEQISGPTLLFYFSPSCPHCRHVAAEVQALHERLTKSGAGKLLGVSSGNADEASLLEFKATYGVTFPIVLDTDRAIAAAMSVQSTPSAMLVERASKGKLEAKEIWYPYLPGFDDLIEARLKGDLWSMFQPGKYLGNNTCAVCHTQEYASYRLTHHSIAFRTLLLDDKHTDPECTGCHVTGAGQPGGWDGAAESALVDVGCEACHGPGGPHDGTRTDATGTCAACHDAKHSIAFSLDKGLPLIDHFLANTLVQSQLEERLRVLYAGEAPLDLLAFPTGTNVGSAKCLSCHAVEHAWWSGSEHANGMASLRAEGSDKPECVRCHATAKRSGPAPATLDGFDVLGGVGCESCHGPGEAHVAAGGGTTNIEGLGESCPVCVIEAVCTSCHTPTWSPSFQLQEALKHIEH